MARKIVLKIAAAISAFIATPAFAADMRVKAPPPRAPVPVATTWTGCYVNAGAGYGFFSEEHHFSVPAAGTTGEDQTAGGRGWLGTVGGGCDYRVNSNFVVGVLADYDFMDLRGHIDGLAGAFTGTEKESSAVAVGGRIGYLVTPQILAYINGGWSSTRFDTVTFNASIGGAATGVTLPAHTFNGGFIGGGTEVAVQAVPGLYWRNEYRYATYGSADLQFSGLAGFSSHEARNVQTITTSLVWNSAHLWQRPQRPRLCQSRRSAAPLSRSLRRGPAATSMAAPVMGFSARSIISPSLLPA
jgi:outer membrane immunogenic protein